MAGGKRKAKARGEAPSADAAPKTISFTALAERAATLRTAGDHVALLALGQNTPPASVLEVPESVHLGSWLARVTLEGLITQAPEMGRIWLKADQLPIANGTSAVKQVFNSAREFGIYQVMVQLCPNHLVFPNCALQSFMQFDRMKELVDQEDFSYYLRASVDILVVSTTTFLPMLAIEVDSAWHDTDRQQVRDERKDRLFSAAGVPFLRLRQFGSPSEHVIRSQVAQHLQELVSTLRTDLPGYDRARELLVDLARATLHAGVALPNAPRQTS